MTEGDLIYTRDVILVDSNGDPLNVDENGNLVVVISE